MRFSDEPTEYVLQVPLKPMHMPAKRHGTYPMAPVSLLSYR